MGARAISMKAGKFIVIEGTDGSGKGTQTALLEERLEAERRPFEVVDFPQYDKNIYGKLVGRYLAGEFGGINDISPYLASLAYAGDRMLAVPYIKKSLDDGKLVIANRYVISNMAFMAARFSKKAERDEYLAWLNELEYKTNKVPKEDLVIFLYLPVEIGQQNVDKKGHRGYMKGTKRDIHEDNLAYLKEVAKVYLDLAFTSKHWHIIDCLDGQAMKSREQIHEEIVAVLKKKRII